MQHQKTLFVRIALLLCATFLWAALPASGQEITAAVTGTVADSSGAPIVGASISATDVDRGTTWTAKTNEVGVYSLVRLPVGTYKLRVEAKGFQTAVIPPFTLVMNQTGKINVAMKVGQVSETVEITGAAPLLQTETTQLSNLIDSRTTTDLPLATRNFLQLTLLSPGAVTANQTEFTQAQTMDGAGRPYINGNREQSNNIMLDGVDYTDQNNNEVGFSPAPDAIQEFNIITQNPSAEFGNFAGGIINTTIKSGTNQFHGAVWEFLRNDALNANSWSNKLIGAPKNKTRWNVYGATIGGPIIKNKLFFFADYQAMRQHTPAATIGSSVFTDAERAGDFGALCAGGFTAGICNDRAPDPNDPTKQVVINQLYQPGTTTPITNNNLAAAGLTINPVAAALFASNAYPHAQTQSGQAYANGTIANYTSQYSNQLNNDQGDVKVDYVMSDKDKFYGRYSKMYGENPWIYTYKLIGGPNLPKEQPANSLAVDWTHIFSSNVVNDFRAGYNVLNLVQPGTNASSSLGKFGEGLGIGGSNAYAPGMMLITFAGATNFNIGSRAIDQQFHSTSIQLTDSLIITHGHHQFQTGFQYWRLRVNDVYSGNGGLLGNLNVSTETGSSLADFWLGLVQNGDRGSAPFTFGRRGNIFAFYGQDTWKVTPHLTVNYGLRFEDHVPLHEINNRAVNFGLYTGAIQQQTSGKSLINNYLGIGDFQPRIGIAWSPAFLHDKTVVRLSYGVSSYSEGGGANQQLTQNTGLPSSSVGATVLNSAQIFGAPGTACTTYDNSCFVGRNIKVWDPNFRPEMSQQWNFTIQHQLDKTTSLQVGYVGQKGTHLLNLMNWAQWQLVTPATYSDPMTQLTAPVYSPGPYLAGNAALKAALGGSGSVALGAASNGNQSYNALQMVLQKNVGNGLQAQVAYTYSKCMSDSGGFYGTWGSSSTSHGVIGWQNIYDHKADWGPCFFDTTHVLTSYVNYQLPFGRGQLIGRNVNSVVNQVVGGWSLHPILTWHTGFAATSDGAWWDPSGTGGLGGYFQNERANCSGAPKYLKTHTAAGVQWFSPSTFSEPYVGTFGNCSVGNIRGPGYVNVDLGIHKNFKITEAKRLEFRTDMFNAFNHANLLAPSVSCGQYTDATHKYGGAPCSPNMGLITGSLDGRNIQFALKFYY